MIATATATSTVASGYRTGAMAWSTLDRNFEGPTADINFVDFLHRQASGLAAD
jgi:hypothetical protein